ncbi:MAG TPA: hypothetical protein VHZ31_08950 [Solirubrobacteraceae bacterium]|jgi:hypothetical protein|nr:hypothetical protein [Solirubrobacteraceae bacterium]
MSLAILISPSPLHAAATGGAAMCRSRETFAQRIYDTPDGV